MPVATTLNGPDWVVWADLLAQRVFYCTRATTRLSGPFSSALYIAPGGNPNFIPHLLTAPTFVLANSPSLSCTCLKLCELLALVMEGEGSPAIDIVGDAPNGPLPEASTTSFSSDASSSRAASDV
jgi:hypothetical protein